MTFTDSKNDFETLFTDDLDRLEWFRRKVAEIGVLLARLPLARRESLLNQLENSEKNIKQDN